jgi:hypothetical protein
MQLKYADYCSSCRTAHHVIGGFFASTLVVQHWSLFIAFWLSLVLYQVYDGLEDAAAQYHTKWDLLEVGFGIALGTWTLWCLELLGAGL